MRADEVQEPAAAGARPDSVELTPAASSGFGVRVLRPDGSPYVGKVRLTVDLGYSSTSMGDTADATGALSFWMRDMSGPHDGAKLSVSVLPVNGPEHYWPHPISSVHSRELRGSIELPASGERAADELGLLVLRLSEAPRLGTLRVLASAALAGTVPVGEGHTARVAVSASAFDSVLPFSRSLDQLRRDLPLEVELYGWSADGYWSVIGDDGCGGRLPRESFAVGETVELRFRPTFEVNVERGSGYALERLQLALFKAREHQPFDGPRDVHERAVAFEAGQRLHGHRRRLLNSSGDFRFNDVFAGDYVIEAWTDAGLLAGVADRTWRVTVPLSGPLVFE